MNTPTRPRLFSAMLLSLACIATEALGMARRPPAGGQTPGVQFNPAALAVIVTNRATVVQGGTVADAGLFNGPVMIESAESQVPGVNSRVLIAFNFGADAAPNAPRFDEKTQDLKNDLGRVLEKATANPYAAAAVAGIQAADKALAPPPALPLGDRTAGQGYMLFEGASVDAKEFGIQAVDAFAEIRAAAHGTPRANAELRSTDRLVVSNDATMVTTLGLRWIDYLTFLAEDDQEDPAPSPAPDRKPDGQPDLPDAGTPLVGDNNGLWKPVSDNNGRLVVLTPANVGRPEALRVNGNAGSFSSIANGNRAHFRFPNPGASYGKNVEVVAVFPGGKTLRTVIPDGSKRTTWRWPSIANPPAGGTNTTTNVVSRIEADDAAGILRLPADVNARVRRVQVLSERNGWEPPAFKADNWLGGTTTPDGVYRYGRSIHSLPAGTLGPNCWLVTGKEGEAGKAPFYSDGNFVVFRGALVPEGGDTTYKAWDGK